MTIKTLFGLTFEQIHEGSVESIVNTMVEETMRQTEASLTHAKAARTFVLIYLDKARPHVRAMFSEILTQNMLNNMRKVYDTEERFDICVDIASEMGNIGIRMQPAMEKILREVQAELE